MAHQKFSLRDVFSAKRPLIGVVHLLPLPGSPRYKGSMADVADRAKRDARAYAEGGLDGLILENYGDLPFYPQAVPPETVAAMAWVGHSGSQTPQAVQVSVIFIVICKSSLELRFVFLTFQLL